MFPKLLVIIEKERDKRLCSCSSAEAETKSKLEKVAEIKKLNAQMMAIRSEISKFEDALKEYQLYRQFLESLSPKVSVCHFFDPALGKRIRGRKKED